jgi:hypothetical protein
MSHIPHLKRWIAAGLLASTALTLAAPAFARDRRYKRVQSAPVERVVVRERSSSAAPLVAGLIGGFILGQAVSSQSRTVVQHDSYDYGYSQPVEYPSYRYYDPYGDDWYDSLDQCEFQSGGPRVVFVIDVSSGHRVRSLQYNRGRWNRYDGDVVVYRGGSRHRFGDSGYRYRSRERDDDHRRYRRGDDDDRRHRRHDRDGDDD